MQTSVLRVDRRRIGRLTAVAQADDILDGFDIQLDPESPDASRLRHASEQLRNSDIPVAFPTETVYGLGADATRSAAVQGIYRAKKRPSDNPLIVHFASINQLRHLLSGSASVPSQDPTNGGYHDPIPEIYKPLISSFWPGPLTIILPNSPHSPLAPEVTAGLSTFGARIPRHALALALIKLAGVPVAAPSANASTKPSPTAAEHVAYDLDGRIETIIDGGPCDVGVESTVVDGLSSPPLILRPGGISIERIRACPGWENTQIGYRNVAESGEKPRAPGMKYRHYSPKATVVLYEAGKSPPSVADLSARLGRQSRLGVITTKTWNVDASQEADVIQQRQFGRPTQEPIPSPMAKAGFAGLFEGLEALQDPRASLKIHHVRPGGEVMEIDEIPLGARTADISRGIFSALRELDRADVDAIFVEGIDDAEGDTAAAVMNRLRKAAEVKVAS